MINNKLVLEKNKWQNITNIDQMILKHERELGKYKGRIVAYQDFINGKKKEINKLNKEMEKTLSNEREHIGQLRTEQQKVHNLIDEVEKAVKESVSNILGVLEEKVEEIFKMITNKPREFVSIKFSSADGRPQIITNDSTALSMGEISDGERQVVMFSLISALKNMSPAEVLVVDAPFGRLDSKHINSIISLLPSIAPQTILFLTDREYQELNKSKIASSLWELMNDGKSTKLELVG